MGLFSWIADKCDKFANAVLDFFGVDRRPDNTAERIYYTYKFSADNYKRGHGYEGLSEEGKEEMNNFCANLDGQWLFNLRDATYDDDIYVCVEGKDGKIYTICYPFSDW